MVKTSKSSKEILAGIALALTGVALLAAIQKEYPVDVAINGSSSNNLPTQAWLPANYANPLASLKNDSPPAIQFAKQDESMTASETSMAPGVYVTHPYVIAVLVPGAFDRGIFQGSANNFETDEMAIKPQLRLDPIK